MAGSRPLPLPRTAAVRSCPSPPRVTTFSTRSSAEVAAMLARLSPTQHQKFLAAICDVQSVLDPSGSSATQYSIRQHRPGDMGWVVQRHGELYWQEYHYDERFEALVAQIAAEFIQNFDSQRERCWIAERDRQRLG